MIDSTPGPFDRVPPPEAVLYMDTATRLLDRFQTDNKPPTVDELKPLAGDSVAREAAARAWLGRLPVTPPGLRRSGDGRPPPQVERILDAPFIIDEAKKWALGVLSAYLYDIGTMWTTSFTGDVSTEQWVRRLSALVDAVNHNIEQVLKGSVLLSPPRDDAAYARAKQICVHLRTAVGEQDPLRVVSILQDVVDDAAVLVETLTRLGHTCARGILNARLSRVDAFGFDQAWVSYALYSLTGHSTRLDGSGVALRLAIVCRYGSDRDARAAAAIIADMPGPVMRNTLMFLATSLIETCPDV